MLSTDVSTQVRDRGDEMHVNSLSFSEIYDLYEDNKQVFEHYTVYGDMPYICSIKSEGEKNKYLKDLFNYNISHIVPDRYNFLTK